jgi:16S rRNA (guanine966-N2)-methyltransferase
MDAVHSNRGKKRESPGRIRIIGGAYRGRKLAVADRPGLRPTPDRVRETLFNWLGQQLDGLSCLDLFAGTGALGFEAASRGARRVVLVEKDPDAFRALASNRDALGASRVELVHGDALAWLRRSNEAFDVVFLDPPFGQNALPAALDALGPRMAPGARAYVEAGAALQVAPPWQELRAARAGQVSYQLLRYGEEGAR